MATCKNEEPGGQLPREYDRLSHDLDFDPEPRPLPGVTDLMRARQSAGGQLRSFETIIQYLNRGIDDRQYAEVELALEVMKYEGYKIQDDALDEIYTWMKLEYNARILFTHRKNDKTLK